MTSFRFLRRPAGILTVAAVAGMLALSWAGMAAAQAPKEWRALEADPRTLDYRNKLRDGSFDATSRAFLTDIALPQLALPANRDTIDRVRRRIRELLVADPSLPTIADYATRLARDEAAPNVVRVNAMLLLGELVGKDRRPWPGAAQPLVAALGDPALPPAVRVAAAAGLSDHVAAAGKDLAATAGPVLLQTAQADPASADPVAVNWLAGRAFMMLAMLGPDAPAETSQVAAVIVADQDRPLDLRVRAAMALGGSAAEGRTIDAASTLRSIRELAVAVIREAKDRSKQLAPQAGTGFPGGGFGGPAMGAFPDPAMLAGAAPGAGGPFGGGPEAYAMDPSGMQTPLNEGLQLAFRRSAWRLAKLADAVDADGGKAGLSLVAGPLQPNARQMATVLRGAATLIDGTPSEASLNKARQELDGLEPAAKPGNAAESAAPAAPAGNPAATAPGAPQPAAQANPFAQ